jgi:hypothetical protein
MGGTTTGEHGVGAVRTPYMVREHGAALGTMLRLKQALDPRGIMNPAKIFPDDVSLELLMGDASKRDLAELQVDRG